MSFWKRCPLQCQDLNLMSRFIFFASQGIALEYRLDIVLPVLTSHTVAGFFHPRVGAKNLLCFTNYLLSIFEMKGTYKMQDEYTSQRNNKKKCNFKRVTSRVSSMY